VLASSVVTTWFRAFSGAHPQAGCLGVLVEHADGVLALLCAFTLNALVFDEFTSPDEPRGLREVPLAFGSLALAAAWCWLLLRRHSMKWAKMLVRAEDKGKGSNRRRSSSSGAGGGGARRAARVMRAAARAARRRGGARLERPRGAADRGVARRQLACTLIAYTLNLRAVALLGL
jgi:hypothetical protein